MLVVLLLVWCLQTHNVQSKKPAIVVAGLFPVTSTDSDVGKGVLPAVELALEHINERRDILPGYKLEMDWNDTQCDMAVGTRLFFDMMHSLPPKAMLFGGACTQVTTAIAESTIWWNITQLSYADTNPVLSDRAAYPNFFRTVPSDSDFNPARMQLLRHFNWTRVGTLFQDASRGSSRYSHAHNKLLDLLDKAQIERQTESFSSDPKPALTNLKHKDVRIIIGNFDEEMARKVFCAAVHQKMVGPKYAWIILGNYKVNWWKVNDTSIPCSMMTLTKALEGYIGTDVLPLSTSGEYTVSGLTAHQYEILYNGRRHHNYSKFHGYAYDGVWAMARALDVILKQNGGRYVTSEVRSQRLLHALNETNFLGVTGRVLFKNGDRVGGIVFKQFKKQYMQKVGEYDAITNEINFEIGFPFQWQGPGPPRDRTLQERHLQRVNLTIYVSLCIIAACGIVFAVSFLAINIKFRNHRYIKMSSPNMNNLILIGGILAYVSVFLLGTDTSMMSEKNFPVLCSLRGWTLCLSFSLSFGAIFSKTWRVHAIFTNIKLNKKVIRDYKLFILVAVILAVDIVILSCWQGTDPVYRITKVLMPESDPLGGDVEIIPVIEYCASHNMNVWMAVIYAFKGLLLIFGCFLAWETRQVSIPALNDSKYIGMSVYNVVIMCVSGVPISYVIKDRTDAAYLIIALFIIFCTTITLCLVFVPKLIELKRDPRGEDKRVRATLRKSSQNKEPTSKGNERLQKIKVLTDENQRCKNYLENKNKEIRELLVQLGEDGMTPSPAHRVVVSLRNSCNDASATSPTHSTRTTYSDDTASVFSVNSVTNLWSSDKVGRVYIQSRQDSTLSTDTSCTEQIELSEVRRYSGKLSPIDDPDSCLGDEEETTADERHVGPPPAYHDVIVVDDDELERRSNRTPSYQGLYCLGLPGSDGLRETAILSDSDDDRDQSLAGPSRRSDQAVHFPTIEEESYIKEEESEIGEDAESDALLRTDDYVNIECISATYEFNPDSMYADRISDVLAVGEQNSQATESKGTVIDDVTNANEAVITQEITSENNNPSTDTDEPQESSTFIRSSVFLFPNNPNASIRCEFIEYI